MTHKLVGRSSQRVGEKYKTQCTCGWDSGELHSALVASLRFEDHRTSQAVPDGNAFYGWFDDATQTEPTYDPPHNAPCPFCGYAISGEDVRTHNLMYVGQYAARSYFYRTHRTCDEDPTHMWMDSFILEMIKRNGD